jgi:hypothetical protein
LSIARSKKVQRRNVNSAVSDNNFVSRIQYAQGRKTAGRELVAAEAPNESACQLNSKY